YRRALRKSDGERPFDRAIEWIFEDEAQLRERERILCDDLRGERLQDETRSVRRGERHGHGRGLLRLRLERVWLAHHLRVVGRHRLRALFAVEVDRNRGP